MIYISLENIDCNFSKPICTPNFNYCRSFYNSLKIENQTIKRGYKSCRSFYEFFTLQFLGNKIPKTIK